MRNINNKYYLLLFRYISKSKNPNKITSLRSGRFGKFTFRLLQEIFKVQLKTGWLIYFFRVILSFICVQPWLIVCIVASYVLLRGVYFDILQLICKLIWPFIPFLYYYFFRRWAFSIHYVYLSIVIVFFLFLFCLMILLLTFFNFRLTVVIVWYFLTFLGLLLCRCRVFYYFVIVLSFENLNLVLDIFLLS